MVGIGRIGPPRYDGRMIDPTEMIPFVSANVQHLSAWEQGFLESVQALRAAEKPLSPKQHAKLCVIHTRLECAGRLSSNLKNEG